MAPGPGLSLHIAEKRFRDGSAPLLSDFRLEIAPGSVTALLGPSGTGKSTLLRLIAGIDRDFTGTILLDGIPAAQAPAPGLVFQDARLLPWRTALDNVRLAASDMSRETAQAALDQVGLSDQASAWPHALSGGMQRRVALARAIASNARLLLLDEPFVSLDAALVTTMQQLLSGLIATTRPTVIFTTHHASETTALTDRIITLEGRPARILSDRP